ncbi:MAG: large subunit ribosomal protein [Acidimicrobiaceae bacterium]|jgi:large subunit ribosomal protein L9|nr:large subunit ribosomal protein [Acidimicrobiaceae bacterium]MDQ1444026.1 large subunit ribosomal protein [Acidimicrobiaceae bacterium]
MRVVLRTDVDGVGKKGDILDVADGFARNYLIPKGRAIKATDGVVAQAAAMRRSRDLKDAKDREGAETVARTLVPLVIKITARAGTEGRLFGSITAQDVVDAVQAQSGVALDRRKLHLEEPIKSVGTHSVPVRLHPEVQFPVTVEVVTS